MDSQKLGIKTNFCIENSSTTFSSTKNNQAQLKSSNEVMIIEGQAWHSNRQINEFERGSKEASQTNLQRQPSMPIPLKSTQIIRNIHTVKRQKRICPSTGYKIQRGKFYKIKSCDDLVSSPGNGDTEGQELQNQAGYRWDNISPFLSNPIEVLRQERLRKERIKQQKIIKEKEKLQALDHQDIR